MRAMLVVLQALAFTSCVLLGMLPSTQVQCRFDVPVVAWPAPPPVSAPEPSHPSAADPPKVATSVDESTAPGTVPALR